MYIVLVLLWIIFNGRFTVEILIFGMGISAFIYWFMCRFLDFSPRKDLLMFREFFLFLWYVVNLLIEILKANRDAFWLLMSNKSEVEPYIVHFKTDLKTEAARVILADSITLTPGTVTVSLEGDEFYVHCLDKTLAAGLSESSFVKILRKMEKLTDDK
ncbi:MAG: Na+/H+ antiporter subunit E [Lachnospiraceae bacterium]|nr:Na+/H+ antiporter subunit E [Lachnospiraceae bacterium]